MGLFILGIFLILWGAATALIALLKPKSIWQMGKIQGFIRLLGDTGTAILFLVLAAVAEVFGIWLVISYWPF